VLRRRRSPQRGASAKRGSLLRLPLSKHPV
jgi:hypothetical protein